MDKQTALQMLGLAENASTEKIQAALKAKQQDIAEKKANAPTDALKAKFESLEAKLSEAEKVLSADSGESQPRIKSGAGSAGDNDSRSEEAKQTNPSPLSQTKLADLPGLAPQDAAQVELQPGQTIANRYEIKELIGQGGMGAVYRAFDKNRDEDIAIKVLLPSLTKNERALERFLNEARVSSKLSHPNIVNVFDVQNQGGMYFLTMELLEGQDLRQIMENQKAVGRPLDIEDVKDYLQQICDGLNYSHEITIHRDIKPENIWVTDEGKVKIMDFGIAQLQSTSQRTQTGAAMGTAYYMAPEQLKGRSDIGSRADQYAVAVLAYELLTEEVPAGVIEPIGELRSDIPSGMAGAIMKAMSARPENRFDDMLAFKGGMLNDRNNRKKRSGFGGKGNAAVLVSREKNKWLAIGAVVMLFIGGGVMVNLERIMLSRYDAYLIFPDRFSDPEKLTPDQIQEISIIDTKYSFFSNANGKYKLIKGKKVGEYKVPFEGKADSVLLGYQNGRYVVSLNGVTRNYEVLPLKRGSLDWYKVNLVGSRDELINLESLPEDNDLCHYGYKIGADGRLVNYNPNDPKADDVVLSQKNDVIFSSDGTNSYGSLEYRLEGGKTRFGVDVDERNIATPGKPDQWSSVYGIYECEPLEGGGYQLARYMQQWVDKKRNSRRSQVKALNLDWVNVPGGTFKMGSKKTENEQPIHAVKVPTFKMMSKEVTVGQFRMFVEDTGYLTTAEEKGDCFGYDDKWKKYEAIKGRSWRNPGFNQGENDPVVCISWWDAVRFSDWVGRISGIPVALPSEAQWEYAARGGSSRDYHFGNNPSLLCRYGNVLDNTPLPNGEVWKGRLNCSDGYLATAPGGHYQANQYGLYDMHGNVWEWVHSCWSKNYHGAPSNGSSRTTEDCWIRVLRGGSWFSNPSYLRSASRLKGSAWRRTNDYGFRLVQDR